MPVDSESFVKLNSLVLYYLKAKDSRVHYYLINHTKNNNMKRFITLILLITFVTSCSSTQGFTKKDRKVKPYAWRCK